jgi:hypothetical protein
VATSPEKLAYAAKIRFHVIYPISGTGTTAIRSTVIALSTPSAFKQTCVIDSPSSPSISRCHDTQKLFLSGIPGSSDSLFFGSSSRLASEWNKRGRRLFRGLKVQRWYSLSLAPSSGGLCGLWPVIVACGGAQSSRWTCTAASRSVSFAHGRGLRRCHILLVVSGYIRRTYRAF